ncbi:uncharacterized protein LOC121180859 [Toxotes jaculatrix]|uniref:uncharacterized protein LOC121180859 n=1 Tax=Toxotes jaculatrix TaxID=941984 RepID=UPI001B3AAC18|nr:uncharacterized protein LOC121180859 [Toxotes jaculatrix]
MQRKVTKNQTSRMEIFFLILIFLEGGLWETEAMSVTGVVHREVTIKCSHTNADSNVKYFCRGECRTEDVLIRSREKNNDSRGKYSIRDNGNIFYVTISHLTEDDSGTYWCGIDRIGLDTYSEVILTVIKGETQDPENGMPQSEMLVYIGAGLGGVVLALGTVLLIFVRHRNRHNSASSGKDHNTVRAAPSRLKQDPDHITTAPSTANEDEDTDSRTNSILSSSAGRHQDTSGNQADDLYSNVTILSETQDQAEGLFYSTIIFNKHTNCTTVTPNPALVTYSTIAPLHKSTDESAAYNNV